MAAVRLGCGRDVRRLGVQMMGRLTSGNNVVYDAEHPKERVPVSLTKKHSDREPEIDLKAATPARSQHSAYA